ncbi:hypothetical protein DERP_004334 [Dermatophagoides pteronyssinus]|uniref:Uncharacterized protein n=1 Tax=Dermatophagoides pteronyssinus TaxID=6956 RepID=A0ABQ8JNY9_DERPT|nr:hypothetical protein DERP_004334 [Dermatophagoides pteronyssinus]
MKKKWDDDQLWCVYVVDVEMIIKSKTKKFVVVVAVDDSGGGGGVWMDFGDFATLLFCLMLDDDNDNVSNIFDDDDIYSETIRIPGESGDINIISILSFSHDVIEREEE